MIHKHTTEAGTDFRTWERENLETLAVDLTAEVVRLRNTYEPEGASRDRNRLKYVIDNAIRGNGGEVVSCKYRGKSIEVRFTDRQDWSVIIGCTFVGRCHYLDGIMELIDDYIDEQTE